MKRLTYSKLFILSFVALGFFASCEDDDGVIVLIEKSDPIIVDGGGSGGDNGGGTGGGTPPPSTTPTVELSGLLNTTDELNWTADKIYFLSGRVVVAENQTLNIAPGTIIKGRAGTGSLASALIVPRNAKINAVGTAQAPIIFTSEQDNIDVGQTVSPNLSEADNGLWGGLLILGNAPISVAGDAVSNQIEGIPASDTFGLYGGTNPADNSGVVSFVSVRHGGSIIGESNEINGITLGGVGSGTVISNIEVVGNEDDGIEIFGGTVDVQNVLIWAGGDDGLDFDQAWQGTIDGAVVVQGIRSDSAMEFDGPEGSATVGYTVTNVTLIGNQETGSNAGNRRMGDFRDGLIANISNVFVRGFLPASTLRLNGDKSANTYNAGTLALSNFQVVLPATVTDVNNLLSTSGITVSTTYRTDGPNFITAVANGSQTVGANLANFQWTWAAQAGQLN